jgi:predicted nucleic acid-binding protein
MTNTPGRNDTPVIVGDADALIAIIHEDDIHHQNAVSLLRKLVEQQANIIFPLTAVTESITTVQRKLSNPALAHRMVEQIQKGAIVIEEVNRKVLDEALALFKPHGSKQNTVLDAIVAVVAQDYQADAIFSFDGWYKKVGLRLVSELF